MAPRVTVITATYNRSAMLRLTLQSLLHQEFSDFEAWVVGDGCTDDSAAVVASLGDPRLHWLNLPTNTGNQSVPNNEGLRRAQGSYIAYLGHDDLWFPWHLARLVALIEERGADFVHGLCALLGPQGMLRPLGPPLAGQGYPQHFVPPSAWLYRRSVADECGGWKDPRTLSLNPDTEYFQRIARAGKTMVYCPEAMVLKFPAIPWGMYALSGEPPQARTLYAMQENPHQLYMQLLTEIATAWASEPEPPPFPYITVPEGMSPVRVFRHAFGYLVRRFLGTFGQRWPLAPLLERRAVRRHQQTRRVQRAWRGLSDEDNP